MNLRYLNKYFEPFKRRIFLMVGRAIVKAVDDSKKIQNLQVDGLDEETLDLVERIQNYGFTSNPPKDSSEVVIVCVGGNRSHPLAIAVDNREFRKKDLQPGESSQYSDEGDFVLLKRGRILHINTQKERHNLTSLKINNANYELVRVLIDLVQEIISARTFTELGPQPLIGMNQTFPVIKAKLESFEET